MGADITGHAGWTRRGVVAAVGGLVSACGRAADLVGGETGRIARILDGDALALDTGLRVRLAEIEAPAPGFRDRPDQPFAEEASAMLAAAANGRLARLYYGGLSRDRYDRAIAHVIASDETGADLWLNGLMARQGGARVRSFPDNMRRVRRLYALEAEARSEKRGLWADDRYRVRSPDDLAGASGFVIVEGAVGAVKDDAELARVVLDGSSRLRLDLQASLGQPDIAMRLEPGARLRIRGWLPVNAREPAMRLTHWGQVEVVT